MSWHLLEQRCVFFPSSKEWEQKWFNEKNQGASILSNGPSIGKRKLLFWSPLSIWRSSLMFWGKLYCNSRKIIITSLPFGPYRWIFRHHKQGRELYWIMAFNDFLNAQKIDEHNPSSVCWWPGITLMCWAECFLGRMLPHMNATRTRCFRVLAEATIFIWFRNYGLVGTCHVCNGWVFYQKSILTILTI